MIRIGEPDKDHATRRQQFEKAAAVFGWRTLLRIAGPADTEQRPVDARVAGLQEERVARPLRGEGYSGSDPGITEIRAKAFSWRNGRFEPVESRTGSANHEHGVGAEGVPHDSDMLKIQTALENRMAPVP